jgi:hypothetical protein
MAELNAIAKVLKIPVSEMGVNGSAVCVESDSINALACANLIAGRLGSAAIN